MASSALDKYCGSPFWDTALTWNTTDPDLTKCFEKTVLVWAPCIFLWIFSSLEVFYVVNSKNKDIPWNFLNVSKLLINCLLIILLVIDFATAIKFINDGHEGVHNVDIYTPVVKILSFGLAAVFIIYNRKHGLRTSGLLFLFWFLMALCSIPQFRTEIMHAGIETPNPYYLYISYLIYFPLLVLLVFVNCFADAPPRFIENAKTKNPSPEEGSSFLNRLFYQWFDAMAWKGFRKPLENSDLWDMKHEDSAQSVVPLFDKYWQNSVKKAAEASASQYPRAAFKSDGPQVDFVGGPKKKEASVLPALCKAFGPTFLFGGMLKLSQDIMTFVNPQILSLLISFVENKEPQWKGYLYAGLLFGTAAIQTLVLSQYFHRMFIVGMRIRTALISAIYRKALRMSNSAKKERTVGEIVNLMSVDAQKFIELTAYINMIWSAPIQIVLALYFLWQVLGASVLAGLAVMIFLIPVNAVIANRVKNLQIKQMKNKDERVKLMNEVLSGIKVLKLYAWEPSFEAQILKIRDKEIKVLKQAAYLNAGTSFIWSCAPFLVSLVSFGTYIYIDPTHVLTPQIVFVSLSLFSTVHFVMGVFPLIMVWAVEVSLVSFATFVLVDEKHVLDAKTAFVSLSLFNVLRFPLSMLPMMISNMVQAWVSVKRINKFMNCEELDPDNVQHDPAEKMPIVIENGNFTWGEEPVLKNINAQFQKGSLTAVVGSVGSGKSSMISALLGEMDKISGRVNTVGSIAYVSQQAWIQNATLQENITFGKNLEKRTYDKVIESCALKPDFEMLPAGDQTEIGEKGINLSGGQKQRVSLARAVYSESEIYLLDDPLSAVDSHVGKHIFDHVIGPTGLLQNSTRVLVTHGITYLPLVDKIIVLKDGQVSEVGTYRELLDKKGAFSEFLIHHLNEIVENNDDEHIDELKNQLSETSIMEEFAKKLTRHRSRVSESKSETGSEKVNGALQRQKSTDSANDRSLRQRSSSIESMKKDSEKVGEKLIEAEKAETGSVKWDVYKHYLRSIGVFLSIMTILLNVLFQGFNIGSNIWLSIWSEDKEMTTGKRDMYLGVYGALGFGQGISVVFISTINAVGTLRAAVQMHETLVKIVLRLPLSFFDATPVGRILNRFSNDVHILDVIMLPVVYIQGNAFNMSRPKSKVCAAAYYYVLQTAPVLGALKILFYTWDWNTDILNQVFSTLFVISYTTPIFVAVIIPIGFVYYLIQRFYVATSRQLKRLESVSRSPIYSHFGETVTGSAAIRAYGVTDRFIRESEGKVDFNQISYYPSIIANRWLAVRLEMVGNLIILFAALFAVIDREQNPGLVGLSVTYALQITQTLNWLVRMTSDVETNIVAVERIKEYGESTQEAAWDIPNKTPPVSWPDAGTVVFANFAVRYRPGLDLVLKGVNFSVNGGEKIGIVGRTGAGKSSLTLALFRIIEAAQGEILIDGINIAGIGLHALRSRLTIIPQDAVLFSGSLRMNLDPFDKHSDDDIWRSLEHAHLKEFVKGLASGLNHEVTEGGENLSVGQRQLICLSRALLRKTKVLILDEATAAVDLETDDLIQRTIRTEFRDCTVLTIAHRLNTIMDSDRVIVLDKGYIVEFDSPSNLLQNRNSIFYGMAKDAGLV